jgi:hypothetical protein
MCNFRLISITNLPEMKFLFIPLMFISFGGFAQYKNYKLTPKGDTIDVVDKNDVRQGPWVVKVDGVRGEPGYEEEGIYKNGKKEGVWRVYTLMGDLYAIERYRWGNKDGKSQYYNIAGLVREESWKATNPENPYDTVDVYDPLDVYKVRRQIVKLEGSSAKHGTWKYFDPITGSITKTENYFLGKLEDPMQKAMAEGGAAADSTKGRTAKAPVKAKPQAVLDFEKKNAGKKKVKYIDGGTH